MTKTYEIYPPIGIARFGDAGHEHHYIGPEVPGIEPIPDGGFKLDNGELKPCAVKFRIYEFDDADGNVREITLDQAQRIEWTVEVANRKCAWVWFRGQYFKETFNLRNNYIQGVPGVNDNYEHCDTRTKLIVAPGPQSINGQNSTVTLEGTFNNDPTKIKLGTLRTDEKGRLIVVAGTGHSYHFDHIGKPPSDQPLVLSHEEGTQVGRRQMDQDNWIDTSFDGHVKAKLTLDGVEHECLQATVGGAPPHFAHGVNCQTSLYDLIEDIYERQKKEKAYKLEKDSVNYWKHIYPVLKSSMRIRYTNFTDSEGHSLSKMHDWFKRWDLHDPKGDKQFRTRIFNRIRFYVEKKLPEEYPTTDRPNIEGVPHNRRRRDQDTIEKATMPELSGNGGDMDDKYDAVKNPNPSDTRVSLTRLQYERFKMWEKGEFVNDKPKQYKKFEDIHVEDQPHALTFAALEWTTGAALFPGIEFYWIVEFGKMYDLTHPFRFNPMVVKPGYLTRGLAIPWQTDFYQCNTHWWPAVRPDDIVDEEYYGNVKDATGNDTPSLAWNLRSQKKWDRGLHHDRVPPPGRKALIGESGMVRWWSQLGFVSKIIYGEPSDDLPEIYVEQQRGSVQEQQRAAPQGQERGFVQEQERGFVQHRQYGDRLPDTDPQGTNYLRRMWRTV